MQPERSVAPDGRIPGAHQLAPAGTAATFFHLDDLARHVALASVSSPDRGFVRAARCGHDDTLRDGSKPATRQKPRFGACSHDMRPADAPRAHERTAAVYGQDDAFGRQCPHAAVTPGLPSEVCDQLCHQAQQGGCAHGLQALHRCGSRCGSWIALERGAGNQHRFQRCAWRVRQHGDRLPPGLSLVHGMVGHAQIGAGPRRLERLCPAARQRRRIALGAQATARRT